METRKAETHTISEGRKKSASFQIDAASVQKRVLKRQTEKALAGLKKRKNISNGGSEGWL